MKTKVTEQGLVVPKHFLGDIEEVEIRKEQSVIYITPVGAQDPIFELGKEPVVGDVEDASIHHDRYLYASWTSFRMAIEATLQKPSRPPASEG